ncbi:hypothetical protein LWI28_001061 [Acer negundo]|uniref:Uncharacterized protein n=1 Tax=Acer negundo TaxID=4023 RepID=A0AAD5IWS9_ACENE|nr:hypothetical protein LWI28_001061 [Acer negundo]
MLCGGLVMFVETWSLNVLLSLLPNIPEYMSDLGKDLLTRCFARNPRERWTVEMLLSHPYLLPEMAVMSATNAMLVRQGRKSANGSRHESVSKDRVFQHKEGDAEEFFNRKKSFAEILKRNHVFKGEKECHAHETSQESVKELSMTWNRHQRDVLWLRNFAVATLKSFLNVETVNEKLASRGFTFSSHFIIEKQAFVWANCKNGLGNYMEQNGQSQQSPMEITSDDNSVSMVEESIESSEAKSGEDQALVSSKSWSIPATKKDGVVEVEPIMQKQKKGKRSNSV